MPNKSWYQIRNAADGAATILIYEEIGTWGIDARMFRNDLAALGDVKDIAMHIHSPGGDVFEALAIFNILKRHPARITGYVDGVAASAASIIAMAADELVMPRNTWLLIHNVAGGAAGSPDDLRDMADLMDRIKTSLVSAYQSRAGDKLSEADILGMMSKDTWISAEEAVEMGLADRVEEEIKMAASIDPDRFRNPPESIRNQGAIMPPENNTPATEPKAPEAPAIEAAADPAIPEAPAADPAEGEAPEALQAPVAAPVGAKDVSPVLDPAVQARLDAVGILNACTEAGLSNLAAGYIEAGLNLDQVKAKIANSGKIKDLCLAAKLPARAENYIKAGLSADEVKAQLFDVLVTMDSKTAIDNSIVPQVVVSEAQKAAEKLNPTNIYANRNR